MGCRETGDSGAVRKPEASWQSCAEFLGIGTGHLRGKPGSFRPGKEEVEVSVARGRELRDLCLGEMQARKGVSHGHEDEL